MTALTLDAHLGGHVTIEVCANCQAFWFDQFASLQLSPGSTLKLMKFIGEHSPLPKPSLAKILHCPRCPAQLLLTHDLQRATRFSYWRCDNEHGRFIGFFDFLKEKNFIHPLSPQQIEELRQNIQVVNCSNCGAAIDLQSGSVCSFCHSPVSMLDMHQPQQMLAQLREAAGPAAMNAATSAATSAALPMQPASLRPHVEISTASFASLAPAESDHQWWSDASSHGLVYAGLNLVARLLID
jgi:hypothetical protein